MYLDEIVAAQKRGEAKGITSICSAHPYVIRQALQVFEYPLLEATCNQVNQFGGYTGMTPKDFVAYVKAMTEDIGISFERVVLGGDHLGPNVWRNEPAESAMQKSEIMIRDYVKAGFTKIHLDCSMKLADDPQGELDVEIIAKRAARLAKIAEQSGDKKLRYIIGTEVPIPGGATEHEDGVSVTKVEDVKQTIEVTREAFLGEGLESAWERIVGVVVQPGVEFGDDFVLPYLPEKAKELSRFIESQLMIYEAHSTDYQTRDALANLVRDHFAILKVGPGLTFAFREAVFALAMMEDELIAKEERSNLIQVLDDVMMKHPEHWVKYYRGSEAEQAFKRKYSLSDRARYYWTQSEVQGAFKRLMKNLGTATLPYALLRQFVGRTNMNSIQVIQETIGYFMEDYRLVCNGENR